jgi:hypothetical protein
LRRRCSARVRQALLPEIGSRPEIIAGPSTLARAALCRLCRLPARQTLLSASSDMVRVVSASSQGSDVAGRPATFGRIRR